MDDEVLFEKLYVRVTSSMVAVGSATFPVRGITSIRKRVVARSPAPILFGAMAGVVGALVVTAILHVDPPESEQQRFEREHPLAQHVPEPSTAVSGFVVALDGGILAVCLGAGFLTATAGRPRWSLVIGTAGGDRETLVTRDTALLDGTKAAIERAIVAQG